MKSIISKNRLFIPVLLTAVVLSSVMSGYADTWWDKSWSSRQEITVNSTSELAEYQLYMFLSLEGTNGSDIRFTYLNTSTGNESEIPFWRVTNQHIETTWEPTMSRGGVVVKIPLVSPSKSNKIFVYYNSKTARDASDPQKVYDLFDDFNGPSLDTVLWSPYERGELTTTFSNGILHVFGDTPPTLGETDGGIKGWRSAGAFGLGTVFETRVSIDHGMGYNYNAIALGYGKITYPVNSTTAAFLEGDWSGGDAQSCLYLSNPQGGIERNFTIDSTYHSWRLIRNNATSHAARIGPYNTTYNTNIPITAMPITLGGMLFSDSAGHADYYVDYVLVRKWSSDEPSYRVGSEKCALFGDDPPCGQVTLTEVMNSILLWSWEGCDLSDVIDLINAWVIS
jgi:hypothetical protein